MVTDFQPQFPDPHPVSKRRRNQDRTSLEPETLKNKHVERIPETLGDAIEAYRDNSFIREILGEHIYVKYLEAKEEEWRDFRAQVTDWEVNQYLYKY